MNEKIKLNIKDFNLFCEVIKSAAKIVDSVKITIGPNGLEIYGARNTIARCEILSNTVCYDKNISFCILDLKMFVRILGTVAQIHNDDYSNFNFIIDLPFIRFESKKFKTKFITCSEDVITKWISKKIETPLEPIFEFTTTSDFIKRINNHSYIFNDASSLRVYLETKDDMEKNSLFATIGNKEMNLNNEITLKVGLVNSGKLDSRSIILDLERLNLFNSYNTDQIKISLMNLNVLVSKIIVTGKNDSFFKINIYNTLLKS